MFESDGNSGWPIKLEIANEQESRYQMIIDYPSTTLRTGRSSLLLTIDYPSTTLPSASSGQASRARMTILMIMAKSISQ